MAYPTSDPLTHCHVHTHSPSLFVPGLRGHVSFSIADIHCFTQWLLDRTWVTTNTTGNDLHINHPHRHDDRRIAVIASGFPLWNGAQVAVDPTLVPPFNREGQPRCRGGRFTGAALQDARTRKSRTYPELLNNQRSRWVGQCWQWKPQAGGTRMVEPSATTWHEQEPDTHQQHIAAAVTARWSATLRHPTTTPLAPTFLGETRKMSTMSKPIPSIRTCQLTQSASHSLI